MAENVLIRTGLRIDEVVAVAGGAGVDLHDDARARIAKGRTVVEELARGDKPVYGLNTGFGLLANNRIDPDQLEPLQVNLIRSHAAGVGDPLPHRVVRATMLLRANVMATGRTGVRPEVVDALIALINNNIIPVVPSRGSVGASGDLAPLSHLALVLIGEGEAFVEHRRVPGLLALRAAGLEPLKLQAKEGLSLVNGTQVMTALGVLTLVEAERLARTADVTGAMSVEALRGTPRHFDTRITDVRPHPGAIAVSDNLRRLLDGSEIAASHATSDHKLQDPYSLRCMPQVHGAVRDAIAHVRNVISLEVNSVTDNPIVFQEDNELLSGGNFHGQPVALAMDYLSIALSSLANISERRTEQMVNPRESDGLQPFLADNPGLQSGFMLPHVTAAALVSENKTLSHPSSVDSIPTSGGQEDHVSMGMTAALHARHITRNTAAVLAIELLAAARGLDLRAPHKAGTALEVVRVALGERIKPWTGDRALGDAIDSMAVALRAGWVEKALEKEHISLH